jgi:hypothetical protein
VIIVARENPNNSLSIRRRPIGYGTCAWRHG